MKRFLFLAAAAFFFASCNNSGSGKTFCDTTCTGNEIALQGDPTFQQSLSIKINNCVADSVTWTHGRTFVKKQIYLPDFLNKEIRIHPSAVDAAFQDTTQIWLTFNDCLTGRGYLLKLPYSSNEYKKITGALTAFDPKFSIDPDLRAYTDRGNLYVANVKTGQEASMTFKREFDINFDELHKGIDSMNVTKQRMYIKLIDKDGSSKEFEKNISL